MKYSIKCLRFGIIGYQKIIVYKNTDNIFSFVNVFFCYLHTISVHVPLSYFSFQAVLYDWRNKGSGMYYPVCVMMHIKEPLLLIGKSSLCGDSRFPFLLSEMSFTICLTPYKMC